MSASAPSSRHSSNRSSSSFTCTSTYIIDCSNQAQSPRASLAAATTTSTTGQTQSSVFVHCISRSLPAATALVVCRLPCPFPASLSSSDYEQTKNLPCLTKLPVASQLSTDVLSTSTSVLQTVSTFTTEPASSSSSSSASQQTAIQQLFSSKPFSSPLALLD